MNEPGADSPRPKRRVRYRGTHPRRFDEKYKELNPEKYPETISRVEASGKTPAGAHRPIMVAEVLQVLNPRPGEFGVDCTLGYGGHSLELLKRVTPGGRLVAIDTDPIEIEKTTARLRALGYGEDVFVSSHTNFAALPRVLTGAGLDAAHFIFADLGVSSMQLDNPSLGFSYKFDAPLDLRMNPHKGVPAAQLLRDLTAAELRDLLAAYSDEPFASEIASAIVTAQRNGPITTTTQLARVVCDSLHSVPRQRRLSEGDKPVRRVFQALRILVNDEFAVLEQLLRVVPQCLLPGGRFAVLTFHSGEDRRVKHALQEWRRSGSFHVPGNDPVRPSIQERNLNSRSSSAKLRWAVRI